MILIVILSLCLLSGLEAAQAPNHIAADAMVALGTGILTTLSGKPAAESVPKDINELTFEVNCPPLQKTTHSIKLTSPLRSSKQPSQTLREWIMKKVNEDGGGLMVLYQTWQNGAQPPFIESVRLFHKFHFNTLTPSVEDIKKAPFAHLVGPVLYYHIGKDMKPKCIGSHYDLLDAGSKRDSLIKQIILYAGSPEERAKFQLIFAKELMGKFNFEEALSCLQLAERDQSLRFHARALQAVVQDKLKNHQEALALYVETYNAELDSVPLSNLDEIHQQKIETATAFLSFLSTGVIVTVPKKELPNARAAAAQCLTSIAMAHTAKKEPNRSVEELNRKHACDLLQKWAQQFASRPSPNIARAELRPSSSDTINDEEEDWQPRPLKVRKSNDAISTSK